MSVAEGGEAPGTSTSDPAVFSKLRVFLKVNKFITLPSQPLFTFKRSLFSIMKGLSVFEMGNYYVHCTFVLFLKKQGLTLSQG